MNTISELGRQCIKVAEQAEEARVEEIERIITNGGGDTLEYVPTLGNTCADPGCPSYGRPLVDRGYGYPVCETAPWNYTVNGIGYNVPMKARYLTERR